MRPSNYPERPRLMAHSQSESAYHAANSAAPSRSRPDDSWVEVSSRPSSSSLSSVADEIITTGLRVQQDPRLPRRRRRLRRSLPDDMRLGTPLRSQATSSSQDEYDESESESESESDQVLSSSNEGMQSEPSPRTGMGQRSDTASAEVANNHYVSDDGYADDDDDENATAVGTAGSFRPQPNAFSHPPASLSRQNSSSHPHYGARRPSRASYQRHSFPSQHQHSPYNVISPSHHVDHDAALRASLSTLLSYAAATRGIPKSDPQAGRAQTQPVASNRIEPTTLGLVPESVALGEAEDGSVLGAPANPADKGKRKAIAPAATGNPRSSSKDRRVAKKPRRALNPSYAVAGLEDVSPTLLTWVVGAGMLVLVSAISFSAGYVVGREAGHAEAAVGMSSAGASAVKRELVAAKSSGLGLRRFTGAAVGATA